MGCDVWLVPGFLGCNGWLRFEVGSPWLYIVGSIRFWLLFFFFFFKKIIVIFCGWIMVDKFELFITEFENWVWVVEKFEFGYENLWFDSGLGFDWNLSLFVENFWVGFWLKFVFVRWEFLSWVYSNWRKILCIFMYITEHCKMQIFYIYNILHLKIFYIETIKH